jgi:hypothetical protein
VSFVISTGFVDHGADNGFRFPNEVVKQREDLDWLHFRITKYCGTLDHELRGKYLTMRVAQIVVETTAGRVFVLEIVAPADRKRNWTGNTLVFQDRHPNPELDLLVPVHS